MLLLPLSFAAAAAVADLPASCSAAVWLGADLPTAGSVTSQNTINH